VRSPQALIEQYRLTDKDDELASQLTIACFAQHSMHRMQEYVLNFPVHLTWRYDS